MITVLGSINIDLVMALPGLPKPGETVLTAGYAEAVGGKGANQAVAAARDGASCRFVGCIGFDAFGMRATQALQAAGVDTTGVRKVDAPTGVATVWVDPNGRNMIAVASGANLAARAGDLDANPPAAGGLLVLQMEVPGSEVEAAIGRARQAGATVLLNLAPALPISRAALASVDILVVNEHEAEALCRQLDLDGAGGAVPEIQLASLAGVTGGTVIITLGSAGAVARHDGAIWRIAALPVAAIDTTGAGDCFVGVLAASLQRGAPLPDAMRRGVVAASLACTIAGAEPSFPRANRIDSALADADAPRLKRE